jgi:hypothetical protein
MCLNTYIFSCFSVLFRMSLSSYSNSNSEAAEMTSSIHTSVRSLMWRLHRLFAHLEEEQRGEARNIVFTERPSFYLSLSLSCARLHWSQALFQANRRRMVVASSDDDDNVALREK